MRGAYDSHELPPEQINTLKIAMKHLCTKANYRGTLRAEECEKCQACRYGLRMLEIIGRPVPEKPREEVTIAKLSRQGKALPTLHQRIRKRQ